jgi:hydrogenase expression/formation protein HypC
MCLAVPGRIARIAQAAAPMRTGIVDFGGVTREVNLACVPEAAVGDYVLVHVGFALGVICEAEAERVFSYLRELEPRAENA